MTRRPTFRILPWLAGVAAVAAVAVTAVVARAATPLTTVHPAHLPLSIGLLSGWQVTATAPGSRFDAISSGATAHFDVTSGSYPAPVGSQYFAKTEKTATRAHYRSEDPKASVTSRKVTLESGSALETAVFLQHGGSLAIYIFAVQHGNRSYHFTYYTGQSLASSLRPQFEASARSIRFKT
jgi:hypothetical protein